MDICRILEQPARRRQGDISWLLCQRWDPDAARGSRRPDYRIYSVASIRYIAVALLFGPAWREYRPPWHPPVITTPITYPFLLLPLLIPCKFHVYKQIPYRTVYRGQR